MADYWAKRAQKRMDDTQRKAGSVIARLARAFKRAMDNLTRHVAKLAENYAKAFELTEEEAEQALSDPCGYEEYAQLVEAIKGMPEGEERRRMEARASTGAYSYRMKRAEALKADIAAQTSTLYGEVDKQTGDLMREIAKEADAQAAYEQQVRAGAGMAFDRMDTASAEELARRPWAGADYSERIWGDRERLRRQLEELVTPGILSGMNQKDIAKALSKRMQVGYRNAERLVRTEAAHIQNEAALERYRKSGTKEYQYVSALDDRTCDVCGDLDGHVFEVAKGKAGENLPPMHPWCRCTIVPVVSGHKLRERLGRDEKGKNVLLPGDMTYAEWAAWQQAGCPEDVEGWRKANYDAGFIVARSLSAQGVNYEVVDKRDGAVYHFVEGTRIKNPEVFAGYKGTKPLDEDVAEGLSKQFGGKPEKWQHCKGIGSLINGGEEETAEIHWFYEETVGRVKFFVKKWLDES